MPETRLIDVAKENVLIRAGEASVAVIPQLGGKIASISIRGRELLQAPLAALAPRTRSMRFDESDASGWDECLPSVADTRVTTPDGRVHHVPDHGDLWRVAWDQVSKSGDRWMEDCVPASLTLRADCFSLPLVLERTIALTEKRNGWLLNLNYTLTNVGTSPIPWSWAAHPLFAAELGDRILLPDSIRTLRIEGSGGDRLGTSGTTVSWPTATLAAGGKTDLNLAQSPQSGTGDKLFAGPLNENENWCALERPSAGIRIRVGFDPVATPYLGLWICYGGWPDGPGPKQNCVAIEPTTAPVDSLAQTGPWSRQLGSNESFKWNMHVDFDLI